MNGLYTDAGQTATKIVDLRIVAPEWRLVTESDLNKLRLVAHQLPALALQYINAHTAYFDATHRLGWRPDSMTVREVMHVKRHREILSRSNDGFMRACLALDRAKANADAWRQRNGKKVTV